jgi:RimJ/RimL family protein N-acetyltransferase
MPPRVDPLARYWPLLGLRLATPRLRLEPIRDADMAELLDLVLDGVHEPGAMPFLIPWTEAPPEELIPNTLRYWWTSRGSFTPEKWDITFMVRTADRIVGIQDLMADHFAVTRAVHTGSFVGRKYQGQGIGTEMRAAVLDFAFDHLKAERADSGAFTDNPASLRVSEKLGYRPDGTRVVQRRDGERAVEQRLTLTPSALNRPAWRVQVTGLEPCRTLLGLDPPGSTG